MLENNQQKMNIKETFLNLTKRTYPHGTEHDLFHLLPSNLETDEFGNRFIYVGENPSTMFTCHLDTASSTVVEIKHVIEGNIIRSDGTSILGADDKAGLTILLNMIEYNIKGLYYFFLGEERGCIGSRKVSNKHLKEPLPYINKVVSFDRRGYDSVITHQLGGRCCSETFGNHLSSELNKYEESFRYENDSTGIYTDSAQFTNIYPECTNISVGYNYEHSHSEQQDIEHLEKLSKVVLSIDWEGLTIERKITDKFEEDEFEDYYYPSYQNKKEKEKSPNSWTTTYYFVDTDFSTERSSISFNKYTNVRTHIELTTERLEYESDMIEELLNTLDVDYDTFNWDGNSLMVEYQNSNTTNTSREEMAEYIKDLDFWKELINIK